jgi:hypothetical protein
MPSFKSVAWLCVAASLASFAIGLILARIYLCGSPGPWAFLASFVFCCLGALAFWVAAWRGRSWRVALGGLLVVALAFVLQFVGSGVLLSGCSGV